MSSVCWQHPSRQEATQGEMWSYMVSLINNDEVEETILNYQFTANHQSGCCSLLDPLSHTSFSFSGDSSHHLSVILMGALPSLPNTALDGLLIPFGPIMLCI